MSTSAICVAPGMRTGMNKSSLARFLGYTFIVKSFLSEERYFYIDTFPLYM